MTATLCGHRDCATSSPATATAPNTVQPTKPDATPNNKPTAATQPHGDDSDPNA